MIDLHAHSTHSDGSLTPAALVDFAVAQGLTALALTDHDITSGLPEAEARARETGLTCVPGVELEINTEDGEFHLLGLNLGLDRREIEERLVGVRDHRARRNERIVRKMNEAGLPVTEGDIAALASGKVISRLHFAQYLVREHVADSVSDAFDRFLGRNKPYYDAKQALSLDEAVPLIHRAGGKAVIAHPLSLRLGWERLEAFLLGCREQGLDGIEAWHSDYPPADCQRLAGFGRRQGFGLTAGSDFHGDACPARKLGRSSGGMTIGEEFLEWLSKPAPRRHY
jgi:3',5'-nucleoside bisphosphate phosphatase